MGTAGCPTDEKQVETSGDLRHTRYKVIAGMAGFANSLDTRRPHHQRPFFLTAESLYVFQLKRLSYPLIHPMNSKNMT
jgi:hypothetical protein